MTLPATCLPVQSQINLSQQSRVEFMHRFTDPNFDPFKENYLPHLFALNDIVKSAGEPLEGNLCYDHLEENLTAALSAQYLPKRRTVALMSHMFNNVMEIGFNAGHSALLMLTANPALRLTCIDLCEHKYTAPCYDYLKGQFGERIELIKGNSLLAFPMLARRQIDFDLYIIDGGHGVHVAEGDLFNVIQFGRRGSIICFDDSDFPPLRVMLDMYLMTGKILPLADHNGYVHNISQMIFYNNKA